MPNMFVPEERWAPDSWGINHPLTVRAHREHGLEDAGYGYWGFSPASDPTESVNGYREYGVDAIGHEPGRLLLRRREHQLRRRVYRAARSRDTNPNPTYGDGVVTPHALFLAMHHEPQQAYDNLRKLQRNLGPTARAASTTPSQSKGQGRASATCRWTRRWCMGSIGNVFGGGIVRRAFSCRRHPPHHPAVDRPGGVRLRFR